MKAIYLYELNYRIRDPLPIGCQKAAQILLELSFEKLSMGFDIRESFYTCKMHLYLFKEF